MTTQYKGTEKDYAISLGLAKVGRGRMSLDAKAAVQKAKKDGMTFYGKSTPTATIQVMVSKGTDKPDVIEEKEVNPYADAFMRYEMDQTFFYEVGGKKYVVTGRLACMGCGFSLIGHTCNEPVVLTYHGAQKVAPVVK